MRLGAKIRDALITLGIPAKFVAAAVVTFGRHNDQIARLMAAFYLTLRGTPVMYYGEEIGMENNDPQRKEDVKDPIGKLGWPKEKGRDGERTPMQNGRAPLPTAQSRPRSLGMTVPSVSWPTMM